jgi:hypothetical protein
MFKTYVESGCVIYTHYLESLKHHLIEQWEESINNHFFTPVTGVHAPSSRPQGTKNKYWIPAQACPRMTFHPTLRQQLTNLFYNVF